MSFSKNGLMARLIACTDVSQQPDEARSEGGRHGGPRCGRSILALMSGICANVAQIPVAASIRIVPGRANPVAVAVVAAAAAVVGPADRRRPDSRSADSRRADTVAAIAIATIAGYASTAHGDRAAPVSASCDRAAAIAAATASIAATAAAASIGIIGNQTGGEQNDRCKSGENVAEHDEEPFYEICPSARLAAFQRGTLI